MVALIDFERRQRVASPLIGTVVATKTNTPSMPIMEWLKIMKSVELMMCDPVTLGAVLKTLAKSKDGD